MFICAKCGKSLTQEQTQSPCPYCGEWHVMVFGVDQGTTAEVNQKTKELAERHYELEAGLTQIFSIDDRARADVLSTEPIKLLEVNVAYPGFFLQFAQRRLIKTLIVEHESARNG